MAADNINGVPLIWNEEGDNELFKYFKSGSTGLKGLAATKDAADISDFPQPAAYQSPFEDSLITYPDLANVDDTTSASTNRQIYFKLIDQTGLQANETAQQFISDDTQYNIAVLYSTAAINGANQFLFTKSVIDMYSKYSATEFLQVTSKQSLQLKTQAEAQNLGINTGKLQTDFNNALVNLRAQNKPVTNVQANSDAATGSNQPATALPTADQNATTETVNLFNNLLAIQQKGLTLFGHQDTLAYGRINEIDGWSVGDKNKRISDVYDLLKPNQFPAIMGWDIGGLEKGSDNLINGISKINLTNWITNNFHNGLLNTICWHFNHPRRSNIKYNNKFSFKNDDISCLLENGTFNKQFNTCLDNIAKFFCSLKVDGKSIPIIFRPFHEVIINKNDIFWWNNLGDGGNFNPPEMYKKLWSYTFDYLTSKGKYKCNNLLFAVSIQDAFSNDDLTKYLLPPNNQVDIVGLDSYQNFVDDPNNKDWYLNETFIKRNIQQLKQISKPFIIDDSKNLYSKIIAFTETGTQNLLGKALANKEKPADIYTTWWTDVLMNIINDRKPTYVQTWRNPINDDNKVFCFIPFKYDSNNNPKSSTYIEKKINANGEDFTKFSSMKQIILQNKISNSKDNNIYSSNFKLNG